MVSVDIKHHVYLLTACFKGNQTKDASWPENSIFKKGANISIGTLYWDVAPIFIQIIMTGN